MRDAAADHHDSGTSPSPTPWGVARALLSRPIAADDAELRAALVSAVMLGVIVSRHLLGTEALSDASPEHIIDLLRPCLRSLTHAGPGPAAN